MTTLTTLFLSSNVHYFCNNPHYIVVTVTIKIVVNVTAQISEYCGRYYSDFDYNI